MASALLALVPLALAAQSEPDAISQPPPGQGDPLPAADALEAEGAVIGEIRIVVGDIFDTHIPGERGWLYRTANKLHIETRERIIRRELLFAEGDPADPDVLYESERNLRRLSFLHDNTRIVTVPRDDGRVDVVVRTRDVWTTRPSVSLRREGNETTGRFSFIEDNFMGFGKRLGASFRKDLDRSSGGVEYSDPRLLGTRWNLVAS